MMLPVFCVCLQSSIVDKYRLVDTDQPQDIPGKVYKFVEWHVGGLFVELQQRP